MVCVRVPATSANLGSGFDALGVALTLYNTVYLEEWDEIAIESLDGVEIPTGEDNLIYSSAQRMFEICGRPFSGLRIRQKNDIPMTRGLGSSSACLVAGLLGANRLLGDPLGQEDLVNLAAALEGHPDNTTPAITGGLVTCAMDEGQVYSVTVPVDPSVGFVAMIPDFTLETRQARAVLPQSVSRGDAVFNLSRAALMAAALFSGNHAVLRVATGDRLHQPYRMGLIRGADAAFRIARDLGAYGAYISGAGPTVMAMVDRANAQFSVRAERELMKNGIFGWQLVPLSSDASGAAVSDEEDSEWD